MIKMPSVLITKIDRISKILLCLFTSKTDYFMWTYLTSLNCCMFTILPLESVGSRGIRKDAPAKINQQINVSGFTPK